jgi:hypothetical protein
MLRRAERKAARIATEWLRQSPDRMLDDIRISRIALFTGAKIRAVAELEAAPYDKAMGGEAGRLLSRQGQSTPLGDIQINMRPGWQSMMRRIVVIRTGRTVTEARMPRARRSGPSGISRRESSERG